MLEILICSSATLTAIAAARIYEARLDKQRKASDLAIENEHLKKTLKIAQADVVRYRQKYITQVDKTEMVASGWIVPVEEM